MNISESTTPETQLAELFRLLSQPARLQILLIIGEDEVCVCHLEAALKQRQAYISQQLMVLRDAGLVTTTRSGKNVYYRLARPEILAVIHRAAGMLGGAVALDSLPQPGSVPGCPCPHCSETPTC